MANKNKALEFHNILNKLNIYLIFYKRYWKKWANNYKRH